MILAHAPFQVLELRFEARLEGPLTLPAFPGAMLRGAYGAALRGLACMTGFRSCTGCPLRASCPYPALFEPPGRDLAGVGMARHHEGIPPPFVLLVPDRDVGADGHLAFGMRLFGQAIDRLAYVIEAWRRALRRGIGKDRRRGELMRVVTPEGDEVWAGEAIEAPVTQVPELAQAGSRVCLATRTPLRLHAGGRPVPRERLNGRLLMGAIIRRARLLAVHGEAAAQEQVRGWPISEWLAEADAMDSRADLVWQDWYRFSARQRQRMNMGGYVGRWVLDGVVPALAPLLRLGEMLHVGKDASFGLGAYRLTG